MKLKQHFGVLLIFGISLILTNSCTKYDDPAPFYETLGKSVDTSTHRKVLMISIDGAVGLEVKKIMPSTIKSMLQHSKYTWNGLSDLHTSDATTWASVATGVNFGKHRIADDSFVPKTSFDASQTQIPFYPTVFYRILNTRPSLKTLAISSWLALTENLFVHANKRITVGSDEMVKDSTVAELQHGNSSLIVLNFMDVLNAGKQSGFSADNPDYVSALNTDDGYVNEILNALKSRDSYDKEDWLVVLTSNHGGSGKTYGGSSDSERNTFTLMYNPKYKPLELAGSKLYNANFNKNIVGRINDPTGIYNNKTLGTFTFEARIKVNPRNDGSYNYGNWDKIVGKSRWGIYRQRNNMKIYITQDGSGALEQAINNSFADGLWHTMTVVTTTKPKSWNIQLYYDGALSLAYSQNKEDGGNTDNDPLTIGGSSVDFNIEEIRLWNKGLNPAQIAENACVDDMTPANLSYSSLIGYWKCNQDEQGVIKNQLAGKPDMTVSGGPLEYTLSANSLPCDIASNVVVQNISIVPQIYYWLNIPVESSWGLDGSVFLSRFESDFKK